MAHRNSAVLARVERSGMGLVRPSSGLEALQIVLSGSVTGRLAQARLAQDSMLPNWLIACECVELVIGDLVMKKHNVAQVFFSTASPAGGRKPLPV